MEKKAKKRSTRQKHPEVTEMLRREIEQLDAYTPLPGERELARKFAVTPITIRKSLRTLEDERRIYSVHRKGTFVAKTMRVAVFTPSFESAPEKLITQSFYGPIMRIVEERKHEYNWETQYVIKENPLQRYPRINRGDLRQFDGIMSLGIQDEDYIGDLEAVGLPVVVADYWPVLSGVDAVSVDGRRAGAMAAEILYDKRHEYLAFIGHGRGNPTHGEFYKDTDAVAMEDGIRLMAGMRGFSRFAVFYPKSGAREATLTDFITDMLSRKERPTGIICTGVSAARDIITTAQRIGLNCPRDFSLITMTVVEDQTDIEKFARLTFALREMGEIVVESMLQKLSGRSTGRHVQIIPTYIEGPSVGDAP